MEGGTVISAAVEGIVDEAVVRKLIAHAHGTPGDVYGRQGKSFLRQKLATMLRDSGSRSATRRASSGMR